MIRFLKGILAEKKAPELTIDVQGIGYAVTASMNTIYDMPDVGEAVFIHTQMIVREDAQLLYGFSTERERTLFQHLIKVNGVGPKLAITILSSTDPDSFVSCIHANDTASLVQLPGIGKKTAERLVIDMRDRLNDWQGNITLDAENRASSVTHASPKQEAMGALISLGYKPQEAKRAIDNVANDTLNSEELIRLGLKGLMK